MQNKIVLITGATHGIGEAAAKALARMGATIVVHGRNPERCKSVVNQIREETGNPNVDFLVADISVQAQVRRLAQDFQARHPRLDVLINNAGGAFLMRSLSVDGIEMTFALNHLSYFLLTNLLLEMLRASAPARIINVSSNSHTGRKLDFDDLQSKRGYYVMRAYGRSKLANILFTYELARRLEGSGVTANVMHPGFVATNIGKNNGPLARLVISLIHRRALTVEEGARTIIHLASSHEVDGVNGKYFVKEKAIPSDPASYDKDAMERLWRVSAEMTGLG